MVGGAGPTCVGVVCLRPDRVRQRGRTRAKRITLLPPRPGACTPFQPESTLNKTPNYKQQKKRREDQQKKRSEEKQRQQAERKNPSNLPPQGS